MSVEAVREMETVGGDGATGRRGKSKGPVYALWAAVRIDLEPTLGGLWAVFREGAEMVPCKEKC